MSDARKPAVPGDRTITLDINLLGRDYKVACKEHERAELMDAVAYLDAQMRAIRGNGKTAGADRIAVMAALNIAHELLRERKAPPPAEAPEAKPSGDHDIVDAPAARRRIQSMQAAIDQALAGQEKLF
ncbi:MAG: cell division protein ZapA [Burkholderiales bacterium]